MRPSSRQEPELADRGRAAREAPAPRAADGDEPGVGRTGEPFSSPCSMELDVEAAAAPSEEGSRAERPPRAG